MCLTLPLLLWLIMGPYKGPQPGLTSSSDHPSRRSPKSDLVVSLHLFRSRGPAKLKYRTHFSSFGRNSLEPPVSFVRMGGDSGKTRLAPAAAATENAASQLRFKQPHAVIAEFCSTGKKPWASGML